MEPKLFSLVETVEEEEDRKVDASMRFKKYFSVSPKGEREGKERKNFNEIIICQTVRDKCSLMSKTKYKYSFVLGIPEAFITWGHQGRSLSNGTLVLNSWEADFFQV